MGALHPGLVTLRDCRRGLATPPGRVSAAGAQNPDAKKRDLSVQIDSEAASLPVRIEKALRQLCRPLECFSDDGGSSSH